MPLAPPLIRTAVLHLGDLALQTRGMPAQPLTHTSPRWQLNLRWSGVFMSHFNVAPLRMTILSCCKSFGRSHFRTAKGMSVAKWKKTRRELADLDSGIPFAVSLLPSADSLSSCPA